MPIKEEVGTNCEYKSSSLKIGKMTVNVKNSFYPKKSLYDILFSIANTRLNEKPA